ncbi:TolC family protein [Novosphingobium sp. PP1Y]|uniref:TolC family protein n=1 Tax=Novosphingobium sp. PP1Y TaxID=702113 RepID=UPI00020EEC44|nr:TolC family protein [Novosphingobium sp. PP1Y]CCA92532.1 outer membrane efflux protein [Novosphingobium sp. PP1Y]
MNLRKGILPLALLLSGCAVYTPHPLDDTSASVLAPPVASVLEARANAIARPWLAPVTLDLSKPLTPDAIATVAVVNNPDLKAQRVRAGVSDAQVFAAGLLPDPGLSLGASQVISGPDPLLDLTSALGVDINALRTRGATRARAEAEARQVRLDLAWAEWQTAGQARIQAARIQGLERVVALAVQSRDVAQSLLTRIQRAAGRGDVAGDRLQAARVALVSAADTLRTAQSNLADAREQLARLLGFPPGTVFDLAPIALPSAPPPVEALFAIAEASRTDLTALRAGYESQEAAVHKAVLDQFPSLNLTINTNRDSAGNLLVGPAVDFTLPLWNRNRGGIAVERATRAALKAEYDARLFQTRADIGAAVAGISVAMEQRADALKGLPELRRYAEASRRAADRGDLSLETAQNADQALRDRRILIAQSENAIVQQSIALELLTGAPREAWPQ